MLEKTMRVLEYVKIRDALKNYAVSAMGRQLCGELEPAAFIDDVRARQAETEEAHVILTYSGANPMLYFTDVRAQLRLCVVGSTLSAKSLLDVAEVLRVSRAAKKMIVTDRDNTPLIKDRAARLPILRELEEDIFAAILSEDEISDRASPELYDIRRKMRQCSERVRDKLSSMIHSSSMQKYLQEFIFTVRNDRYVLPVKQEYRSSVPGLVHDQSATGATLFVEPMAVVEINNELKQWAAKEKQEIERILAQFSADIAPHAEGIEAGLHILAQLDLAFAKAQLSRAMRATAPKLNTDGRIRIVRGRHPLISQDTVVPIDIRLGDEFTTLVVTGPNTGGKTVTLKTVGLFVLMAQAGLHVPAQLGTDIAIFDQVFADIGDEQSIEQSLSTFSSHMTNIVGIVGSITDNSLALFDELGAGTDPTEGAALAMAILDTLLARKIRCMATTHYSELKAYALTTIGVENASVEFNVETLRPTYRLSIGVPGKSNAFEISRKLGLPDKIIDAAGELLSKEQIAFEDVIANAEYHRAIAEKERQLAEQAHLETMTARQEAERVREELAVQRENALKKNRDEAKRILTNAQREAESVIRELRSLKSNDGVKLREHEIQGIKARLGDTLSSMTEALTTPVTRAAPLDDVKPGQDVRVLHLNTTATVLSTPDAKGEVQVQAGAMKLKVHVTQLGSLPKDDAPKKPKPRSRAQTTLNDSRSGSMEVDVRGMTLDEAILAADMFLDGAALSHQNLVSIIHGKGSGVLRSGLTQHLKKHPQVKEYRLGRFGEGEDGVTVVTLK